MPSSLEATRTLSAYLTNSAAPLFPPQHDVDPAQRKDGVTIATSYSVLLSSHANSCPIPYVSSTAAGTIQRTPKIGNKTSHIPRQTKPAIIHRNKSTMTSHRYTGARAINYGGKVPYVNVTHTNDATEVDALTAAV